MKHNGRNIKKMPEFSAFQTFQQVPYLIKSDTADVKLVNYNVLYI